MEQIGPGIYRWTAPHPEYRSQVEEVVSYALVDGDVLALVDPLLPAENDARRAPLLAELDVMVGAAKRLELLITNPYHTRSAETLYERHSRTLPTVIWGTAVSRSGSRAWRPWRSSRRAPPARRPRSPRAAPRRTPSASPDAPSTRCTSRACAPSPSATPWWAPRVAFASGTRAAAPAPPGTATSSRPRCGRWPSATSSTCW